MKNSFVKLAQTVFVCFFVYSCQNDDIGKSAENATLNEAHGTGYLPSTEEQLAEIKELQKSPNYSKIALPESYVMPELPVPLDQGYKGSCVAYAVAHARTLLSNESKTLANGSPNYAAYASGDYLYEKYKHDKTSCNNGAFFVEALDALKTEGTLSYAEFGYVPCGSLPTPAQEKSARKFRINDYYRLSSSTGTKPTLEDIKTQIAAGNPVITGIEIDQEFTNRSLRLWDINTSSFYGRHAVVLTGYDNKRQAFRLLNSWGTWGEKGYIWVTYRKIESLLNFDTFIMQRDNLLKYKTTTASFIDLIKDIKTPADNIYYYLSNEVSAFMTNGELNWNNTLVKPFYDQYNNPSLYLSYYAPTNDGMPVDGDLTFEVRLRIESTKNTNYPVNTEKGVELELWNGRYGGKDQYMSCNIPVEGTGKASVFKNNSGETYKYIVYNFLANASGDKAFATDRTIRFHIKNGQFYIGDTYYGKKTIMPSGINRFRNFSISFIGSMGAVTDVRVYKNGEQIAIDHLDGNITTTPMPWLQWFE